MEPNSGNIAVLRLAATGAISLLAIFAICWIGVVLALPAAQAAPHTYLGLFTTAPDLGSGTALVEGLTWSVVFGFLAGGLLAFVYNTLGKVRRA